MKGSHDIRRLDLNLLFIFDALLRERSVTRAGASLGMTQSAMSHSLAKLRTFFDDPLFVKTHRGVTPTPKAEALGEAVLDLMATLRDQVLSQASFDPEKIKRTFRLCLSDMGELVFLPTLFKALKKAAPNCRLQTQQISPDKLATALGSGDADLAIGSVRNASEGLFQEELFTHTFVSIVSPRNRDVKRTLTREQFCEMPHVVVTLTDRADVPYDSAIDDAGIKRNIRVSTPHFLFIPLLIDQHPEFVATVPRALGTVFTRHGIVKTVEPPVPLPTFALRQYWHPRFHHDTANRWLRGLVKRTFAELPESMR